jgi:3-oxoacyl-[acyl-carrier-protein] synthase-3
LSQEQRAVVNAYISGTGFYVPPRIVRNEDLIRDHGIATTNEWIVQRTGIEERRFADEGVGTSDLALEAARAALAEAGLQPHDLDLIVVATLSPEHAFPGSGVFLQHKLGLCDGEHTRFVPALDVRNQCSGFLYALSTAVAHVRAGMAQHVLVVGAETHSAALDLSTEGRTVASLFGDGAGAVVVSATEADRGVRGVFLGADGRHAEVLCQKIWDIRRRPFIPKNPDRSGTVAPELLWATMDGKLVFKHAVATMLGALMRACTNLRIGIEDIDLFLFHQANMRINQFIAQQLGVGDDKIPHNIQRYGNTTAATIPILLAECVRDGRLRPGMKVAMAAFGSGFTWGAAVIDW